MVGTLDVGEMVVGCFLFKRFFKYIFFYKFDK
jgi:hypothetical protein